MGEPSWASSPTAPAGVAVALERDDPDAALGSTDGLPIPWRLDGFQPAWVVTQHTRPADGVLGLAADAQLRRPTRSTPRGFPSPTRSIVDAFLQGARADDYDDRSLDRREGSVPLAFGWQSLTLTIPGAPRDGSSRSRCARTRCLTSAASPDGRDPSRPSPSGRPVSGRRLRRSLPRPRRLIANAGA